MVEGRVVNYVFYSGPSATEACQDEIGFSSSWYQGGGDEATDAFRFGSISRAKGLLLSNMIT